MVPLPDPVVVGLKLAEILDEIGVPYVVSGSVASVVHGEIRSTIDIDIVADIALGDVELLVMALKGQFYAAENAIREAVSRRSSFKVIYLPTSTKADIYLPTGALSRQEMARKRREVLSAETGEALYIATPEDIVLQKLAWYRLGCEVSDRQWRDVLGVLKLQRDALDFAYMRTWANREGLADLLERALTQAGLSDQIH